MLEFRKYPEWEELDLSKQPYPQDEKKDKKYKEKQNALLCELRQEVQDIRNECLHWLPPEKPDSESPSKEEDTEPLSYMLVGAVIIGFVIIVVFLTNLMAYLFP